MNILSRIGARPHYSGACVGRRSAPVGRASALRCVFALLASGAWPAGASATAPFPYAGSLNGTLPFVVGVNVHLERKNHDYSRAIALASQAGAESVRFDATWNLVEQQKDALRIPPRWDRIIDDADRNHLKVLLILDYGNRWYEHGAKPSTYTAIAAFARYAGFVAKHFKGKIYAYEIWNEWDNKIGYTLPGSPHGYIELLKAVYPVLNDADPNALVLGGSMTSRSVRGGQLAQLVRMGALHYVDGLSLHPYIQCRRESTVAAWKTWVTDIHTQLTQLAGRPVPIYVTEVGWPSSIGSCGVGFAAQAERARDVVIAAHALGFVRGIWWYDLLDDGASRTNPEDQFGLVNSDESPKPAYWAFKVAAKSVEH